ncbi:MAG: glycosyltransferase family 2 protein [Candidatus Margulisiibacteriota bacterium]|nr:MAG: hypothetical protein A2X43_02365 [Candidatus Margulisbacteria bacterium GWD2_39_127]OGI01189.1 MAG: hypothetical protein A2X42_06120 [Candidatus Margulisbacteria bacterium GWF2_38_17]OGI09824.1 MAG: hypothetical protein A2X41_09840 [Candidatus Margulisbacteria bacterium GWE2_39_32]PZM78413.1 MAG: glycosyltransferase family 2 protein [Candidatus Margulisiibacteriota bacterium]HAR62384.1 glycosyl transferase family 2 [Candidatus Margulisiibacteriota bacterium]
MKLSIVIPTYNEELRIGATIKKVVSYLSRTTMDAEIIVVDDGSIDGTVGIVSLQCDPEIPIIILTQEKNSGKGAAVRRGMLQAVGDLVLFSDADLSTPIEELDRFLVEIQNGCDIVIGSRGLDSSLLEIRQPFYRQLMGKTFNKLVQLLVFSGIQDTQCGFKLFTRKAVLALFPKQRIISFAFDVEILYLARKMGFCIKEVPVTWRNEKHSRVKIVKDSLKMLLSLLIIKTTHR